MYMLFALILIHVYMYILKAHIYMYVYNNTCML